MSIEKNVQIVKNFFAALGSRDKKDLLALSAEDIEWIIPGEDWPLAGTHRGHAGLENLLEKANETVETSYPEPPEFIAQGDRVVVVGFAAGRIKATNRTFEDHWVFAITVRNGKVTNIREYIDTLALARGFEMAAIPGALPIETDTIRKRFVKSMNMFALLMTMTQLSLNQNKIHTVFAARAVWHLEGIDYTNRHLCDREGVHRQN